MIFNHYTTYRPDLLARLIDEVRSLNLRINFGALHVWEGGNDPVEGLWVLNLLSITII